MVESESEYESGIANKQESSVSYKILFTRRLPRQFLPCKLRTDYATSLNLDC